MKRLPLTAVPFFALVGCGHAASEALAPQPAPSAPVAKTAPSTAQQTPPASLPASRAVAMACNQDSDCLETQLCVNATCTDIKPGTAECGSLRVHFDFDKSELHRNDELALERAARCIMAEQKPHIVIEGNADERGTEEYNLALGDRRAYAVAQYLEDHGVPRDELRTVSYGKDRPLCHEHNETCWAQNRRAAIKQDHVATTASRG